MSERVSPLLDPVAELPPVPDVDEVEPVAFLWRIALELALIRAKLYEPLRRGHQRGRTVVVDVTGAGDVTVVDAVPGKRIKVLGVTLTAAAAIVLQFKSGARDEPISGPLFAGANGGAVRPIVALVGGPPWFETRAGQALVLNLSAGAVRVGGEIVVSIEP